MVTIRKKQNVFRELRDGESTLFYSTDIYLTRDNKFVINILAKEALLIATSGPTIIATRGVVKITREDLLNYSLEFLDESFIEQIEVMPMSLDELDDWWLELTCKQEIKFI